MSEGTVCGRSYHTVKSVDPHPPKTFHMVNSYRTSEDGEVVKKKIRKERKTFYIKPKTKFIIDGIFHSGGEIPIRFKSLAKAEAYLKNFRLEK